MKLVTNFLSPEYYNYKAAQIVPEQALNESVTVYKDAISYIKCQIKSTIQHEAGHRSDEYQRYDDIWTGKKVQEFNQFSQEDRVEGIAEKEEENCDQIYPMQVSGETEIINLQELFDEVKQSANIHPDYKNDIKAGHLQPNAQGLYMMQDLPEEFKVKQTNTRSNIYRGFDGTLWIDVRKIVQPFIAKEQMYSKPATFQNDGIQPDVPNVSNIPPTSNAIPATPSIPSRGSL